MLSTLIIFILNRLFNKILITKYLLIRLKRNAERGDIMEKERAKNNQACILKIAAVVYKPTKKRNLRSPREEKEQVMPKISSGIGKKFLKKSTDQRTRNK